MRFHHQKHRRVATPVAQLRLERNDLFELLLIAGLFGLAINLIASAIAMAIGGLAVIVLSGGLLLVVSMLYFCLRFWRRETHITLEGTLLYDRSRREFIRIDGYSFAGDCGQFFKSAFAENPALQTQWNSEPLETALKVDADAGTGTFTRNAAVKLLDEVVEYFVISKLSDHLCDYFNQIEAEGIGVRNYSREDIPDVLLRNRFLELFSRHMRDRAAFAETAHKCDESLVVSYGPNKAYYSKFDLTLPKESALRRDEDGWIEIRTRVLTICFAPQYRGMSHMLPGEYLLANSELDDPMKVDHLLVPLEIIVRLHPWGAIWHRNSREAEWVDSFLESLRHEFDIECVLDDIQWPLVDAILKSFERTAKSRGRRRKASPRVSGEQVR